MRLRGFQKDVPDARRWTAGTDTAALSITKGRRQDPGLAARILTRCLTPGDALNQPGAEYLLCAASNRASPACAFGSSGLTSNPRADIGSWTPPPALESRTRAATRGSGSLSSNGKTSNGDRWLPGPRGRRTRFMGSHRRHV